MKVIEICLYKNSGIINKLIENKFCWQVILSGSLFEFFLLQNISQSLRALQPTQLSKNIQENPDF